MSSREFHSSETAGWKLMMSCETWFARFRMYRWTRATTRCSFRKEMYVPRIHRQPILVDCGCCDNRCCSYLRDNIAKEVYQNLHIVIRLLTSCETWAQSTKTRWYAMVLTAVFTTRRQLDSPSLKCISIRHSTGLRAAVFSRYSCARTLAKIATISSSVRGLSSPSKE